MTSLYSNLAIRSWVESSKPQNATFRSKQTERIPSKIRNHDCTEQPVWDNQRLNLTQNIRVDAELIQVNAKLLKVLCIDQEKLITPTAAAILTLPEILRFSASKEIKLRLSTIFIAQDFPLPKQILRFKTSKATAQQTFKDLSQVLLHSNQIFKPYLIPSIIIFGSHLHQLFQKDFKRHPVRIRLQNPPLEANFFLPPHYFFYLASIEFVVLHLVFFQLNARSRYNLGFGSERRNQRREIAATSPILRASSAW